MIIEIQQISKTDDGYKCFCAGENICDVFSPKQAGKAEYFLHFKRTDKHLTLYWNTLDKTYGKSIKERFTMHILEDKKLVGGIVGSDRKGEQGVYDVEYNGQKYISYMWDGGKGDDYLCVYDECKTMVAEIRRTKFPQHNYDYYVAFTEKDDLEELLCLLAVHIDFLVFNHASYKDEAYGSYGYREGANYYNEDYVKQIAVREGFDLDKRDAGIFTQNEQNASLEVNASDEAKEKQKKRKKYNKAICIIGALIIFYNIIKAIMLQMP